MKVVVDTNVILSSLLAPTSPPKQVLAAIQSSHTLVVSLAMAAELGAVIVRPKFARLGTEKERVNSIQALLSASHIVAIVPTFTITHPELADEDDNRLLEAALASHADLIITGDKELLALRQVAAPAVIESGTNVTYSPSIYISSAADALDFLLST